MSQGTMFSDLTQDQTHDIALSEQMLARLLYSAFAKGTTEVSMEKMLSETKAVVHINIIDLQNWEICYLW